MYLGNCPYVAPRENEWPKTDLRSGWGITAYLLLMTIIEEVPGEDYPMYDFYCPKGIVPAFD